MKSRSHKLFVVGNNIQVAKYESSKLFRSIINCDEKPTTITEYSQQCLVDSVLHCKTPQFFLSEHNVRNFVISKAERHQRTVRFVTCPVIIVITMKLVNRELHGMELSSARIYHSTGTSSSRKIYYSLDQSSNASEKPLLKCTPQNFHGDFNYHFLTPLSAFTFLCANARGIQPANQGNTYTLPSDITKQICEYVMGHKLG